MNHETLLSTQREALRGSIGKWTMIVDALEHNRPFEENGSEDCPCCQSFVGKDPTPACKNCPIFIRTGEPFCKGSPYEEWTEENPTDEYYSPLGYPGSVYPKSLLTIAKKELKFLIKLSREYDDPRY